MSASDPLSASRTSAPHRPWRRFIVVIALVALDLWSKAGVFAWLDGLPGEGPPEGVKVWFNGHWRYPIIGDFLGFMLSENLGAAWGVGHEVPYLLVGGRIVAAIVLCVLLVRTERSSRLLATALVLVLSGALGNLYDNLFLEPPEGRPFGAVRDFVHVYFRSFDYHFPTFNVADSCITVGAGLLILSSFVGGNGKSETTHSTEPSSVGGADQREPAPGAERTGAHAGAAPRS